MHDCPFWLGLRDEMRGRGYTDFALDHFRLGFDRAPGTLRERLRSGSLHWTWLEDTRDAALKHVGGRATAMATVGRRNADFAAAVMKLSGAVAFVDASKERMRIRHLERNMPMPLRVIHLVRDVRGVAASALHHASQAGAGTEAAAHGWEATNGTILRHLAELPSEHHTMVRYEDLCRDPVATMERLYAFCGVDPQRAAAPLAGGGEQHLIGNQRRLATWSEITLDERWRIELSAEQQSRITAIGGSAYRQLYPD